MSRLVLVLKDTRAITFADIEGTPVWATKDVDIVGGLARKKCLAAQIVAMKQPPGRNGVINPP